MPRYFFHLDHGGLDRDADGVELPSLEAAKREAARLIGQTLVEDPAWLWRERPGPLVCADEAGQALLTLQITPTMILRPASRLAAAADA